MYLLPVNNFWEFFYCNTFCFWKHHVNLLLQCSVRNIARTWNFYINYSRFLRLNKCLLILLLCFYSYSGYKKRITCCLLACKWSWFLYYSRIWANTQLVESQSDCRIAYGISGRCLYVINSVIKLPLRRVS
jgi:hypothetical protein